MDVTIEQPEPTIIIKMTATEANEILGSLYCTVDLSRHSRIESFYYSVQRAMEKHNGL